MSDIIINTQYSQMLHGFGLPYRLTGQPFALSGNLKTYSVNEDKIISVKRQVNNYEVACNDQPGWLMYVCANSLLDKAKHVAANIMSVYFRRDLRSHWITNVDNTKNLNFGQYRLVIIDSIFFDSSSYRRDKIYELINYNCNVPNLSVLVIGQNTDPLAMANQLGMKPNLAMLMK